MVSPVETDIMPPNAMTCRQLVVIANRIVAKGLAKMTSDQRRDVATRMTDLSELERLNEIGSVGQRPMAPIRTIAVNLAKVSLARIAKERRPASIVRPRAVTAKVRPLELETQVVAGRSGINAISKHRAHHETSALR